jgi:hypothetical protein
VFASISYCISYFIFLIGGVSFDEVIKFFNKYTSGLGYEGILFSILHSIFFAIFVFVPIFFSIENQNYFKSILSSILFFGANIGFAVVLLLINLILLLFARFFSFDNGWGLFLLIAISTYFDFIIQVAALLFYKEKKSY